MVKKSTVIGTSTDNLSALERKSIRVLKKFRSIFIENKINLGRMTPTFFWILNVYSLSRHSVQFPAIEQREIQ